MNRTVCVLLIAVLSACSDSDGPAAPPGPVPGTLSTSLVGARIDDVAMIVDISGGVTAITSARADLDVTVQQQNGSFTAVVFGPLASAPVLNIAVTDVAKPPVFTIREVAGSNGELRATTAGYSVIRTR